MRPSQAKRAKRPSALAEVTGEMGQRAEPPFALTLLVVHVQVCGSCTLT